MGERHEFADLIQVNASTRLTVDNHLASIPIMLRRIVVISTFISGLALAGCGATATPVPARQLLNEATQKIQATPWSASLSGEVHLSASKFTGLTASEKRSLAKALAHPSIPFTGIVHYNNAKNFWVSLTVNGKTAYAEEINGTPYSSKNGYTWNPATSSSFSTPPAGLSSLIKAAQSDGTLVDIGVQNTTEHLRDTIPGSDVASLLLHVIRNSLSRQKGSTLSMVIVSLLASYVTFQSIVVNYEINLSTDLPSQIQFQSGASLDVGGLSAILPSSGKMTGSLSTNVGFVVNYTSFGHSYHLSA